MKATLQILMFFLGTICTGAAFVGLAGVDSSFAFFTSETALGLYAVAGLMLIGFNDYNYRRPIITRRVAPKACPVPAVASGPRVNAYGIRRRNCISA
jgi:hypothetical protein